MTLQDFYAAIKTNEGEYVEALQVSERGNILILKRGLKERFINRVSKLLFCKEIEKYTLVPNSSSKIMFKLCALFVNVLKS